MCGDLHHTLTNGPKIGPVRYSLMEKALKSAVNMNTYNKYINEHQNILDEETSEESSLWEKARAPQLKNARGNFGTCRTRRPIRGGENTIRGRKDNPKRRRQDSTNGIPPNWGDPEFTFNHPWNVNETQQLGNSWPTLQQASKKK